MWEDQKAECQVQCQVGAQYTLVSVSCYAGGPRAVCEVVSALGVSQGSGAPSMLTSVQLTVPLSLSLPCSLCGSTTFVFGLSSGFLSDISFSHKLSMIPPAWFAVFSP